MLVSMRSGLYYLITSFTSILSSNQENAGCFVPQNSTMDEWELRNNALKK